MQERKFRLQEGILQRINELTFGISLLKGPFNISATLCSNEGVCGTPKSLPIIFVRINARFFERFWLDVGELNGCKDEANFAPSCYVELYLRGYNKTTPTHL
jgi:hypothetical protein